MEAHWNAIGGCVWFLYSSYFKFLLGEKYGSKNFCLTIQISEPQNM